MKLSTQEWAQELFGRVPKLVLTADEALGRPWYRQEIHDPVDGVGVGIVGPADVDDPSFFVDAALAMNDAGSGYGEGCADE